MSIPDDPSDGMNVNPSQLPSMVFMGAIAGLVPVLGAFLLYGLGASGIYLAYQKIKRLKAHQNHGPLHAADAPVSVGQTVTFEGAIVSNTTVASVLFTEQVALSVCTGYRRGASVDRERLFVCVLGGPIDLNCGGLAVRLTGDCADLLSTRKKTRTSRAGGGWVEPGVAEWFEQRAPHVHTPMSREARRFVYELEESVVMPGERLTATGVVSAIDDLDPTQDEYESFTRNQRVSVVAPPGGALLELSTLSSEVLAKQTLQAKTMIVLCACLLAIAGLSAWGWIHLAIGWGWFA